MIAANGPHVQPTVRVTFDGDDSWEGPMEDFATENADAPDLVAAVFKLNVGETLWAGGGAGIEATVERVS
jgi:hypothetical protein